MSKKIDVRFLVNTFNAENNDGQYMFVPAELVEFLEKLANDNGVGDAETALVGTLTQARMYHQQYEQNMADRFVEEGRLQYVEEDTDEPTAPGVGFQTFGHNAEWPAEETTCGCGNCAGKRAPEPEPEEANPVDALRQMLASGGLRGGIMVIGANGIGGMGGDIPAEVLAQLSNIIGKK